MNFKIINAIVYGLMAFLMAPTIAILLTWNALPGDKLYSTKRGLEKIAGAIVSPSYAARSELELQLIERRISENEKIFAYRLSTDGLKELTAQAYSAEQVILSREKGTSNTETIQKLTAKLRQANLKLETQKRQLAYAPSTATIPPTIVIERQTTIIERQIVSSPTQSNPPANTNDSPPASSQQPTDIVAAIEDAQDEIEDIIDNLEDAAPSPSTPQPNYVEESTPPPPVSTPPPPIEAPSSPPSQTQDNSNHQPPGQQGRSEPTNPPDRQNQDNGND